MTGVFGINILGQYVTSTDALLKFLRALNPAAFVVMDSPSIYQAARAALPQAIAVYRAYDPVDAEFHLRYSAAGWLDTFGKLAGGGWLQCGNEPSGYGDVTSLTTWYVQVMRAARQRSIRLAIAAFGVGHPDERLLLSGAFDGMIRELADGYHVLLLHEYAKDSTITERPYHVGRFQFWRDRAKALGVKAPQIVLGEYGRDNVGQGTGGGLNDGWIGAGLSEDAYLAFLNNAASLYAQADVPACIFCYGRGAGGAWQSFNIEGAERLQGGLIAANSVYGVNTGTPTPPPHIDPTAKPDDAGIGVSVKLKAGAEGIRLRTAPLSGSVITVLMNGSALTWYSGGSVVAGSYRWYWVESANVAGWMALLTATPEEQFVPVSIDPIPETVLNVPYYSQITSPGATADRNDCGETCVRMVIGHLLKTAGLQDFAGITIDDLTRDAGKSPNAFLSLGQIERLLHLYGCPSAAYSIGGVTIERVRASIDVGVPVIALVTYKHILPADAFNGSHFVLLIGYSSTEVVIHDPYLGGAAMHIQLDQFERAQTDFGGTNPHHSGVFVA